MKKLVFTSLLGMLEAAFPLIGMGILLAALLLFFSVTGLAQTDPCPVMPAGYLCVTVEAGKKALEAGDKAKALEAELTAQKQAYEKMRDALNDMRIQFAAVSGENTALKQNAVSDRAIIDILLKNVKPKKWGLIVF